MTSRAVEEVYFALRVAQLAQIKITLLIKGIVTNLMIIKWLKGC